MRALVSIFAALLIIISVYQLSFTYFVNKHESAIEAKAKTQVSRLYPQSAAQKYPGNKEAQALIAKNPKAKMFHGLIHSTKENPFGYEIELLHLVGPDEGGNGVVFHGDAKTLPVLDGKK